MTLIDIVTKRCSIRNYKNKRIPYRILQKILDAGKWGPSLANIQPGFFVVISKEEIKNQICEILKRKLKKLGISGRIIFMPTTMEALKSASLLIAVYNTGSFKDLVNKFAKFVNKDKNNIYLKIAEQAEISAISAAIQNMILTIENLKLGSCWLHIPLYCEKEINRLIGTEYKLVAVLTIGYPEEKGKRSRRKSFIDLVRFLN